MRSRAFLMLRCAHAMEHAIGGGAALGETCSKVYITETARRVRARTRNSVWFTSGERAICQMMWPCNKHQVN